MSSTLIKGGTLAKNGDQKDILIEDGVIKEVGVVTPSEAVEEIDASGMLLFPGLIDCHVHFREPGFEHKATMASESESAFAGGITCVCEMPNTNPPTVTVMALGDKIQRASEVENVDLRFYFGVTTGEHLVTLKELWSADQDDELKHLKERCPGVKLYLDHSTGNQMVEAELLDEIFEACGQLQIPIIAHCEDPEMNKLTLDANTETDVSAHSTIRSAQSEVKSITEAIERAKKYKAAFHVAHLSTHPGMELVRQAKKDGLPVTCEVAPHHLLLSTIDYEKLGTLCKMNPPVRTAEDCEALWHGLETGVIDCIATDHAPHTLEEKQTEPALEAPSGVPGVETSLPIALTRLKPEIIYKTMFANPNRIFALGRPDIVAGASTPIVIVDPNVEWEIHAKDLHSKCDWTPFEGRKVKGKVVKVVT